MPEREIAPTRIAFLELLDERRLVREGYELLDERRMLLAARILRGLDELDERRTRLATVWDEMLARLADALRAHGLHDLEAWPPRSLELTVVRCVESALGIDVGSATATAACGPHRWPSAADSPTIDACIESARRLLADAVPIAALETSLLRLTDEYRRTERRTRAIENVLLPELNADLRNVESALESLDQEEVVRVHALRGHA